MEGLAVRQLYFSNRRFVRHGAMVSNCADQVYSVRRAGTHKVKVSEDVAAWHDRPAFSELSWFLVANEPVTTGGDSS